MMEGLIQLLYIIRTFVNVTIKKRKKTRKGSLLTALLPSRMKPGTQ
jgi:hypothetical protein